MLLCGPFQLGRSLEHSLACWCFLCEVSHIRALRLFVRSERSHNMFEPIVQPRTATGRSVAVRVCRPFIPILCHASCLLGLYLLLSTRGMLLLNESPACRPGKVLAGLGAQEPFACVLLAGIIRVASFCSWHFQHLHTARNKCEAAHVMLGVLLRDSSQHKTHRLGLLHWRPVAWVQDEHQKMACRVSFSSAMKSTTAPCVFLWAAAHPLKLKLACRIRTHTAMPVLGGSRHAGGLKGSSTGSGTQAALSACLNWSINKRLVWCSPAPWTGNWTRTRNWVPYRLNDSGLVFLCLRAASTVSAARGAFLPSGVPDDDDGPCAQHSTDNPGK